MSVSVSREESQYRDKELDNILKTEKPMCTSCGNNLKRAPIFEHPILGVIVCKKCKDFYGDGEFSVDEDGTDKYCRWCGQGGTLYMCSQCIFGFCSSCIKRNFEDSIWSEIDDDNWRCFSCKPYPLWKLRALCSASLKDTEKKTKVDKKMNKKKIISSGDSGQEQQLRPNDNFEKDEKEKLTRKLKCVTKELSSFKEKNEILKLKYEEKSIEAERLLLLLSVPIHFGCWRSLGLSVICWWQHGKVQLTTS